MGCLARNPFHSLSRLLSSVGRSQALKRREFGIDVPRQAFELLHSINDLRRRLARDDGCSQTAKLVLVLATVAFAAEPIGVITEIHIADGQIAVRSSDGVNRPPRLSAHHTSRDAR